MRAMVWSGRVPGYLALVAVAASLGGCKSVSERYIALEVWKYEKCFGHLPPGFAPPGAAAAPGRACGQGAPAPCQAPTTGCDPCQAGGAGGTVIEGGGMPLPAGVGVPTGPGGSPGPTPGVPMAGGVTAGKPVVISDEVVMP
jgi:hypothetical protein